MDTGGTFTDALALGPGGEVRRTKVLTSALLRGRVERHDGGASIALSGSWPRHDDLLRGLRLRTDHGYTARVTGYRGADSSLELDPAPVGLLPPGTVVELAYDGPAPLLAAHLLTATPADAPLPPMDLRLATTLATNALLTRNGAPPVLITARGLGDLPRIGTQARDDLFALAIRPRPTLYREVVEIRGRLSARGQPLEDLDEDEITALARRLADEGAPVAVALPHSDRFPEHERRVGAILRRAGVRHVSLGSELAPFIGLLARTDTALVNAYLAPVFEGYVERLRQAVGTGTTLMLTSAGSLTPATAFRPCQGLLSGPAGGVAGAAAAGRETGDGPWLSFDMGGTSTDVARHDRGFAYVAEHHVGGVGLRAPALAIETVAAGGGSICRFDGLRLTVGPESAGADPGPACYGPGGPLTLTDVNLLLGRLAPERFGIPVNLEDARRRADALLERLEQATSRREDRDAVLEGLIDLADEKMADAIRRVSVREGYDPADHGLVVFGGAGPQHGFGVARKAGHPPGADTPGRRTALGPRPGGRHAGRGDRTAGPREPRQRPGTGGTGLRAGCPPGRRSARSPRGRPGPHRLPASPGGGALRGTGSHADGGCTAGRRPPHDLPPALPRRLRPPPR
ncbi:MAG: hydantoinase/oxoprolinase family protein [Acidobacteriota bacterium]|nr:hydantoinase/oxoprolinase family protein [Acidobacteriota bacterium]